MNHQLLDLYSDYLLSSFGATTAVGLSQLTSGQVSHDQVSRMLNSEQLDAKAWWKLVKPQVRAMQSDREQVRRYLPRIVAEIKKR